MLYDTQHKQIVLLSASSNGLEGVWSWNGKEWKLSPIPGPPAREAAAAIYDTQRNRIVLFGGIGTRSQDDRLGDLWEWNGKLWEQRDSPANNTRDHHYMAFDESRGRAVVYGGQPTDRSWLTDTSEWDGSKWVKMNSGGPGGRVHFAMVYDSWRKRVLLFGGFDEVFKAHNDLWSWDGQKWEKLSEGGPPSRSHHAMAFDVATGSVVLFGGLKEAKAKEALGDTWIWDGKQWTEIKTASGPPIRSNHVMAYDREHHTTLLYGGGFWDGKVSTRYEDTWQWNGKSWTKMDQ
jgi:hypothetical protein